VLSTGVTLQLQYWSAWNNYNQAIAYLITVPKYRMQAQDIARQEGLLQDKKKRDRNKTKVCCCELWKNHEKWRL